MARLDITGQTIEKGIGNGAVHVMLLLRSGFEAIRVSLLKLPRLPGKPIVSNACFPQHLNKCPLMVSIIWKRRKYHLDCREVARGTQSDFSCLCTVCCLPNGHTHEVKLMFSSRTARGLLHRQKTILMNYSFHVGNKPRLKPGRNTDGIFEGASLPIPFSSIYGRPD